MQQTSLFAYYKLVSEDELAPRQREALNVFKQEGDMTNQVLALRLGLSINQVTPRTLELREFGLIEKKGTVMQKNNRPAIVWGLVR